MQPPADLILFGMAGSCLHREQWDLFLCPAERSATKWANNPTVPQRNPCYGYNMAGSGSYPTSGNGLGQDGGASRGRGGGTTLPENQVKTPSAMIAMVDSN